MLVIILNMSVSCVYFIFEFSELMTDKSVKGCIYYLLHLRF